MTTAAPDGNNNNTREGKAAGSSNQSNLPLGQPYPPPLLPAPPPPPEPRNLIHKARSSCAAHASPVIGRGYSGALRVGQHVEVQPQGQGQQYQQEIARA